MGIGDICWIGFDEIRHDFPLYPFARLLLFFQVRDPVRIDRFERMMEIKADNLGGTFSRK